MKCLLYCTKAKPYLIKNPRNGINERNSKSDYFLDSKPIRSYGTAVNGHIVAECEVECEEIKYLPYECTFYTNTVDTVVTTSNPISSFEKASCLSYFELDEYLNNYETDKAVGYALHISNLKVFDKPLELKEVYKSNYYDDLEIYENAGFGCIPAWFDENSYKLNKAPQNICYVWHDGELKVLISIQSNWLCKILNGEKTIEVRKKVLREMIK